MEMMQFVLIVRNRNEKIKWNEILIGLERRANFIETNMFSSNPFFLLVYIH